VKSVSLDAWPLELAEHVQELGNDKVNALYEATLQAGRKPTEETGNYEVEQFIREKYVNKAWYREEGQQKKKKPTSRKPARDSSSSGSDSDERPKQRKPREEGKRGKRRSTKDKGRGKSREKPAEKPRETREPERPKDVEKPKEPEKPKGDAEKRKQANIFGAEFDAQFKTLQVTAKPDEGFDSKFGDFSDFQSSSKPTMTQSSDIESFFSDAAPSPSSASSRPSTASSTAATPLGSQPFEVQEVPANKPAKDAAKGIMALFSQPAQQQMQPRFGGYDMPSYGVPQAGFAAGGGGGYGGMPVYHQHAAPQYGGGMMPAGGAIPPYAFNRSQSAYAGYPQAAYMQHPQPGFAGGVSFGGAARPAAQPQPQSAGGAFDGLF